MSSTKGKNEKIEKKHLILCEGEDEFWFLVSFLNSDELKQRPFFANDIQIFNFGGNEELLKKLNVLKLTSGFQQVQSLLILRDAERDAEAAVRQIQSALKKAELPSPSGPGEWKTQGLKVGFLLFPTCDSTAHEGTLEDLCLSILKEPSSPVILEEVGTFMELLEDKHKRKFPHEFKTKLHTYFSITDKFVGLKIGEAAKAGVFNWNSTRLDFLKEFLGWVE